MKGWVKLYRQIRESAIWRDCPESWLKVWICLLLEAQHSPATDRDGKEIPLGTCMVTIREFSVTCKLSTGAVQRAFKNLELQGMITKNVTHGITRVTIVNWETYQGTQPLRDTTVTQERHTSDTRVTQNDPAIKEEECKKGRREEVYSPSGDGAFTLTPPEPKEKPLKKRSYSPAFQAFWSLYPKKVGKDAAATVFDRRVKEVGVDAILDGLRRHLPAITAKEYEFQPQARTWLNQGRYTDETAPEQRTALQRALDKL